MILTQLAKPISALIWLSALSVATILLALTIGDVDIAITKILPALFGNGSAETIIVRDVRLPRTLAAWLAGACLGAAGAGLQGLLRNPLADPGVLGLSAMSTLGAVIALYFGLTVIGGWVLFGSAVCFALVGTAILFALGAGRVSTTRLILIGVGISSFCGALSALAMNLAPNPFALSDLINWLLGTVANRNFNDLAMAAPVAIAGLTCLYLSRIGLRGLALGEETAQSLGVDLKRLRRLTILGCALLVGASVSLAGTIGFVGIVAPHLVRPLVGHDAGRLVLPSALLGGVLLVIADIIVRLLPFYQEFKLGVAVAIIGAPIFVWIAAATRRLTE